MSFSKRHNRWQLRPFSNKLKENVYTKIGDLSVEAWKTAEPVPFSEKESGEHVNLNIGDKWGGLWDCAWMHVTGKVPEAGKGKKVVLMIDLSGEGCVYNTSGVPVRGLTTYVSHGNNFDHPLVMPVKRIVDITECSDGNEEIDLWVDAGCNDLFGNLVGGGTLRQAEILTCDTEMRRFFYDYKFLMMLAEALDENDPRREQIEYTLYNVAVNCDSLTPEAVAEGRKQLSYHLNMKNEDRSFTLSAVGHSHIDLAWLWPIRETKRKGQRTFSTALRMMEKYPDYIFGASQPQLYDWIKQDAPALYEQIKQRVKEGRWECQGAMWVEPDTNISGGEALVRQVLYGKKFFREEFGKDMKVLWLPDVFGYSGALPQILKKSDVPYFMTIKLSWSEHNTFPHHTFRWQGIDGSEVLAHMPPEGNYNSDAIPDSLLHAQRSFKDKDVSDEALLLFGIGDGGGGPSTDHLEYLEREKSVAGLPPVKQEPAVDFFERINKDRKNYAKWCGELYLEKHQGTYTTQADNKKYNRLMELALRDCEFSCSMARILAGFEYPQQELETIWKEVLLYQFHDILPGSSIKRVYDESVPRYREMHQQVLAISERANRAIADKLGVGKGQAVVFNTLPWERVENLAVNGSKKAVKIPAYGYAVVDNDQPAAQPAKETVSGTVLENAYLKAEFNADGTIVSIYDKQADREVLNQSAAFNNLVIYEDKGDCWDIPFTYIDKAPEQLRATGCEVFDNGFQKGLRFTYEYNKSKFVQDVTLGTDDRKLRFSMDVEWQETFKMLRGLYPVDIQTEHANCNIQFGYLSRPTHQNTSWDYAKIEICAHKWVDLSEKGYGVAMINDSKYGYNVWNNTLNIDLLRSQMHPGKDADKGHHEFSYELFVHNGDLVKVTEEAYKFNIAPMAVSGACEGKAAVQTGSFFQVSADNIIVEAVKMTEDRSGYVLRMYECDGRRTTASVNMNGIKAAELTNMMEDHGEALTTKDGGFNLTFKPFEIHTVKVTY